MKYCSAMERLQRRPGSSPENGRARLQDVSGEVERGSAPGKYFQVLEETAVRKFGTVPWSGPARSSLRFAALASG